MLNPANYITSERVLEQRVRNRLIESVELWCKPKEKLRAYQNSVPFVHVPSELFEQFYDTFDPESIGPKPDDETWGILTESELRATREFELKLREALNNEEFDEALESVLASQEFETLSRAASLCLQSFEMRGKLDEEQEEWR